jgi:UDP-2-acetamido-3-amino-2,3-dideoxy-glucuronate N-acetyltransferase
MPSAAPPFVHPLALCESKTVGAGTQIWAFAHIMAGAVVGRDCNIGGHAFIEAGARIGDRVTVKNQAMVWEGVEIGDDVFIGPGASFTNDVFPRSPRMRLPAVAARYKNKARWLLRTRVAAGASLGAGCVVLAGVKIGAHATIAAGSVIIRDVAAHALMVGVPAVRKGWVCRCGARLIEARIWRCPQCGETYDEHVAGECTSLAKSC